MRVSSADVRIEPIQSVDLEAAQDVLVGAFATYLGLEPDVFADGREILRFRASAESAKVFVAKVEDEVVGSVVATVWGSAGFLGPLTVAPAYWNQGIAQRLLDTAMHHFAGRMARWAGLYTFSNSPRHIALYQRFGFWPRFLTAICSRASTGRANFPPSVLPFSHLSIERQEATLVSARRLTDELYPGLDLRTEIRSLQRAGCGETLVLASMAEIDGFAICHYGPGSEAPRDAVYVKFAAMSSRIHPAERFVTLLDGIDAYASRSGAATLEAGMNLARHEAYRTLLDYGFRPTAFGVEMHRFDDPGISRAGVFAIDDLR
jgi:predicted N-acetyltransferase YhbS